jgi:hypothetical protein
MNQQKFYCCNVARRDRFNYVYSIQDIKNMFSYNICMAERVSEVFSAAMGNDYFVAKFNTLEEVNNFTEIVLRKW